MNKTKPFLHTGRTVALISLVFYILPEQKIPLLWVYHARRETQQS